MLDIDVNLREAQKAESQIYYKNNLIYFQFEFNWHAFEIEHLAILISNAQSDTIYM